MLIVGAVSGIQEYLFDIAQEGGRQARRLRARSFFIQLLCECACLRIRTALSWNPETVKLYGAGRFLLEGPQVSAAQLTSVRAESAEIERWLLGHAGAQLRFNLGVDIGADQPLVSYRRVMRSLERNRLRAVPGSGWVMDPISPPCAICRHRRGEVDEHDEDSQQVRRVCRRCYDDVRLGGRVLEQRARFLLIREGTAGDEFDVAGLGISFAASPAADPRILMVADLRDPEQRSEAVPPEKQLRHPIARHIPLSENRRPIEFLDLARMETGAPLLGVLKMDVDSLGQAIQRTLQRSADMSGFARFSLEMDRFFAYTLDRELDRPEWDSIYTVFSGGDDLLLVGPWSKILAYAGHVQRLFSRQFPDLTLSAGAVLIKPKHPLRHAADLADDLLATAKESGKDCCAALGQCWPWRNHHGILDAGVALAGWVTSRDAQRGWLMALLRLHEERFVENDQRATARLAYHVNRNYPSVRDRDPRRVALRQWIDRVLLDFDDGKSWETKYLPAVVRYALLATRRGRED